MNKPYLKFIFATLCLLAGNLKADYDATFEVRSSAYFPNSHHVREVYGNAHPTFGVEVSQNFCNGLNFWGDIDYFSWSMHKKPCCRSRLQVLNTSFGLRWFYAPCEPFKLYLGIGACLSGVNIRNKVFCETERARKFAAGGVLKSGLIYTFCAPFYLNLFVDYVYLPLSFHGYLDVGGLKTGLGLGVEF